jgi:hypothetical protein
MKLRIARKIQTAIHRDGREYADRYILPAARRLRTAANRQDRERRLRRLGFEPVTEEQREMNRLNWELYGRSYGGQDYDFDVLRCQIDELMMRVAAQAWRDLDEQWRKRWET